MASAPLSSSSLGELVGYKATSDGFDMTQPSGEGRQRTITRNDGIGSGAIGSFGGSCGGD